MEELNIDATNTIAGRLATRAAKEALIGKKVNVFNAEKAVISGDAKKVAEKYRYTRSEMGQPRKGPFIPKMADRFLRRIIRGMLPYKQVKGKKAFDNIKCYLGVPKKFEKEKIGTFKEINVNFKKASEFLTLKEIAKHLGR